MALLKSRLSPSDNGAMSSGELSDQQVRRVLLTLLLGGIVVSFSNSALNPAIPVFMSVFAVDIVMGGWVLNAYVLAMSVGLMLSGYLSKKFAFKRVYSAAILGFMLGSVLGMLAPSMLVVIAARAVQGLSGGLIIPLSIGMLYQVYAQSRHGRVMALWGIVIMMSLAVGPLVGAYLVEQFAWWTLFAITVPLSAIVILLVWLWIPSVSAAQTNVADSATTAKTFDSIGFISLLVWLLALMTWLSTLKTEAYSELSTSAQNSSVGMGVLAVLFLVAFVLWWRYERSQSQPLLEVRLFSNVIYLHSTIISITQTLGLMLGLLLLPIVIQEVMGKSALWTGAVLAIATLVSSVTTHFAGKQVDARGARGIGLIGIVISASSMLMLAWCLYQPTLWLLILIMSLQGIGVGLAYLPTTTVGFSSLAKSSVTEGAALNNISRRIVSAIFITVVTVYIDARGAQLLALGQTQSMSGAMQEVFVMLAVILLLTLPSAYRLPKTA